MTLLSSKPGQKIIGYFALGIVVGTIFLMLPVSSTGKSVDFIDITEMPMMGGGYKILRRELICFTKLKI